MGAAGEVGQEREDGCVLREKQVREVKERVGGEWCEERGKWSQEETRHVEEYTSKTDNRSIGL